MIEISGVEILGIASTIPKNKISNESLSGVYGEEDTKKLITSVGVNTRHVAPAGITTSDLCLDAATRLINSLEVDKSAIGAIVFVSQTPDYQFPATACILQDKLGLPESCIAFDVNQGCSGYIYGLYIASTILKSGIENVLLLVGDLTSATLKPGDRSTEFLFGDAGTATLLSTNNSKKLTFELGTDGSGFQHIIATDPQPSQNFPVRGLKTAYCSMNGAEVFAFTLRVVPPLIKRMLTHQKITSEQVETVVYHQANNFMLKHLSKKSKLKQEQVPISIDKYGNTSSASIPLTLCSCAPMKRKKSLLVGFGVGLSWGAVFCDLSDTHLLAVNEFEGFNE